MTERISTIAGIGAHLPRTVMTNDDLAKIVDTSDAWIRERTGIRERRIAGEGETTVSLGAEAARQALANAGISANEVDLIIVATTTPDLVFPSSASMIQAELGILRGAAFDIQAVCSGFIYALSIADGMLARRQSEVALVIGSETMSRILDWTDRGTCVLFGDGAGAWVLTARDRDPEDAAPPGILGAYLRSDGRFRHLLYTEGGPSTTQTSGLLRMAGNQVFRHAIVNISESMTTLMKRHGVSVADIDWFVPHQANQRILEGVAKKLGIPAHKVISTVALHGNTSAASVPLAFEHAVSDGRIQRGDLCLMEALGGGFTWGAALVRY